MIVSNLFCGLIIQSSAAMAEQAGGEEVMTPPKEGKIPPNPHSTIDYKDGAWAHTGPNIPPVEGVPTGGGGGPQFECKPHPYSVAPNIICHPAYEDRLGCQNGGASKMCDTIATASGTTCACVNVQ